jgi:hypothetical protein
MAAGYAARLTDSRAAVPQHPRMRVFPINRKRFINLEVLARLDAATAENALIGVVAIERICIVDFVRLGSEWNVLMLDS